MEPPPSGFHTTKFQIIAYYVQTLHSVLGSEKEAQMCIYHASWDNHFGFCCDIDEGTSLQLAGLPSVKSVKPDPDYNSTEKDYICSEIELSPRPPAITGNTLLFPLGNSKHWLVKLAKPGFEVVSMAQMIDHCTEVLSKVMGNYKDAQMCIYHISCKNDFGFGCELDQESAQELADLPDVLSVERDKNFESTQKDYGGDSSGHSTTDKMANIKTKKLFITGLSFYTSEKTLREAFDGFGELVEVKIIMDKISKRSKGYAFVEYTTEEAAAEALMEMNEKIINGWMITVDVAKSNPTKYSRGRPRTTI